MIIGKKLDEGKLRFSLLPLRALAAIVGVLEFGAKKYSVDNWKHVENPGDRYYDAMLRHIFEWKSGTTNDNDSGQHHLAHAGCCLLFLLWFDLKGKLIGLPKKTKTTK